MRDEKCAFEWPGDTCGMDQEHPVHNGHEFVPYEGSELQDREIADKLYRLTLLGYTIQPPLLPQKRVLNEEIEAVYRTVFPEES